VTIEPDLLRQLQQAPARDAWQAVSDFAWQLFTAPLDAKTAAAEVMNRDRQMGSVDLFLSTAGWDLWQEFDSVAEHTSDALIGWWNEQSGGRAVLILDALSLREAAWIVNGALELGYRVQGRVTAAELPADTTPFAKALGFGQRSALENNQASATHRLTGATTDSVDLPWADCLSLIGSEPRLALWHHWPDARLHTFAEPGKGLNALTQDVIAKLTDESFWALVERMTTGRRLLVTSDHGYAATGLFPDTHDEQQAKYLKEVFRSGRCAAEGNLPARLPALPPVDVTLDTRHGRHRFVLGRRKWRSQGGYPTLAHGGLSVLEVLVPFIELSR
jgi:hypothetical protein